MTEFAEQIAELLRETARAHHAALAEEEGHDHKRLPAIAGTASNKVEEYAYGRFGWCMDPEGNRIEFWEPR